MESIYSVFWNGKQWVAEMASGGDFYTRADLMAKLKNKQCLLPGETWVALLLIERLTIEGRWGRLWVQQLKDSGERVPASKATQA